MPKVSEAHLAARRRQILDAAVACFSEQGFHRTTMQDIVGRSGLSPGAIYRYFDGKEAIVEAIAAERHAVEMDVVEAAVARPGLGEGVRALRSFFELLRDPHERTRRRVAVQMWGEALSNPRVRDTVVEGIEGPLERLADMARDATRRGQLPAHLDADAVGRVMLSLALGFIVQQAWDEDVAVDAYLEVLDELLAAWLGSPSPAGDGSDR